MRLTLTFLVLAQFAGLVSLAGTCSLESITTAQRTYDLASSQLVLQACRIEAPIEADEARHEFAARAALAVAELYRIDYEATPETERAQRRTFGTLVDTAADEGLTALEGLTETSERLRLEADLLATKIRSDFRANKFGKRMKAATLRALELDPENILATVSQAKPFLFAETRHGGDLQEAVRILTEALAIDPTLESALLLRALAYERLGRAEASRKDLLDALEANPTCRPAVELLRSDK